MTFRVLYISIHIKRVHQDCSFSNFFTFFADLVRLRFRGPAVVLHFVCQYSQANNVEGSDETDSNVVFGDCSCWNLVNVIFFFFFNYFTQLTYNIFFSPVNYTQCHLHQLILLIKFKLPFRILREQLGTSRTFTPETVNTNTCENTNK